MRNFDTCRSFDIRYSTGNSEDSIKNSCRQIESLCRSYGDLPGIIPDASICLYISIGHFGIAMELAPGESLLLDSASMFDNFSKTFRCLCCSRLFEFTDLDARNLDEYIDSIKNWPGESRTVAFDHMSITAAFFIRVTHIPTRTWIHRTNERKSTRISAGHIDTINRDFAIFEWLTKCLKNMFVELEKFIKKEDSLVRQ